MQLGSVLQEAVSSASRWAPGRGHLAGSSEGKAPSLGWDRLRLQFAGGDIPVYVLWVAVVALLVCTRLGVPLVSLEVSVLLLQAGFFALSLSLPVQQLKTRHCELLVALPGKQRQSCASEPQVLHMVVSWVPAPCSGPYLSF